jgi:hypothetical protein
LQDSSLRLFKKYQNQFGFTTLQAFKKAGKDQQKALLMIAKATQEGYRVAVTVVEAANCLASYKKGDKLVFNLDGQSIPEESTTARMCWGLIWPLSLNFAYNEALMANGIHPTSAYNEDIDCIDPGLGHKGGFGHVKVRVQIEKTKGALKTSK